MQFIAESDKEAQLPEESPPMPPPSGLKYMVVYLVVTNTIRDTYYVTPYADIREARKMKSPGKQIYAFQPGRGYPEDSFILGTHMIAFLKKYKRLWEVK